MVDPIYRREPLVLEGRITTDRPRVVSVDGDDLSWLLTSHFGPWQLRADGETLPGDRYRITIERLED